MIMTGMATFMTKFFEAQLGMSSPNIAHILGCVAMPSACGGILLGGYCVYKLNLGIDGILRMCLLCSIVPWFTSFILLYSCPNPKFFGLNHTSSRFFVSTVTNQFEQDCNAYCFCPVEFYNPVCGKDNATYYSPCFAGCKRDYVYDSLKAYTDCSCIMHEGEPFEVGMGAPVTAQADRKKCALECNALGLYLTGISLYMFFTFLLYTPGVSATIRCVHEDLKALSLGLQWMAVTLLGAIPAATVVGFFIDNSCVLWNSVCDQIGACAVHDNGVMSRNLFTVVLVLKTVSVLLFLNALICLKTGDSERHSHGEDSPDGETSSVNATHSVQSLHKMGVYHASSVSLY
ncbi:solute carrier organic anion transporter family member 4A1-like [Ixodes scapularis]|uniref:solute carrier organic anion transporter family member 4A1-like n=1 Tax=Ixodes scapularis TaxID=6945 RepID=UPI001C394F72|nr:solute carrier organic anion transporter family member 4A1-like [Ixodes scapularis]